MTQQLRHIAVHVTEPSVGDFRWVLTDLADDQSWSHIRTAQDGVSTYRQAMADGLLALQSMVYDLDEGPRSDAMDTKGLKPEHSAGAKSIDRNAETKPGQSSDQEESREARGSVFGFGLAN